jgi:beta-lactamase superfamily II metal-dependent hydrolase
MAQAVSPNQLTVRMYQVGFGDCFLLSFGYPTRLPDGRTQRHMLVDMGSNHPPTGRKLDFSMIAQDIAKQVGTTLDVVVLSHRHKDHLAGFGDDGAAAILEKLQRQLIVRPWTEDPSKQDEPALKALTTAENIATAFVNGADASEALGALAARQAGNARAITRLDEWAKKGAAEYLSFGAESRIAEFVPGIKVHVLGPPLQKDAPDVIRARSWYDDQYWLTRLGLTARPTVVAPPGNGAAQPLVPPGPVRWLVDRLGAQHSASAMRLIHEFDKAMNNTSVILLIEAGTKRLLFGGDAQWESWEYALTNAPQAKRDEYLPLLRTLDLYKVGHHGSLNATPKKSLFGLWDAQLAMQRGMMALISTCCGVYPLGRPVPAETPSRVPRSTLVDSLQDVSALYSTTDLGNRDLYLEVGADLTAAAPFKVTAPAALAVKRRDLCPPFGRHIATVSEDEEH